MADGYNATNDVAEWFGINENEPEVCEECDGTGLDNGHTCKNCGGKGYV